MVKKGDRVTIDGKTAKVQGWWGQGKTRVFQLDDGRTVFDLHLLLEEGDAKLTAEVKEVVEDIDPVLRDMLADVAVDEDDEDTLEDILDAQED